MAKKCAVCGKKISFWASEYSLSKKYTDIAVCDPCDDLLRASRKGDKESYKKLKGVITDNAQNNVKEYIESLRDAKLHDMKKTSSHDPVEAEDELLGVSRKNALNSIKYSKDEKPVKSYCCSTMSAPYGKGYLIVTNKRVIYTGITKNSRFVNEMGIDDVSGINTMYGKRVKLTRLLFGILLVILGIIGACVYKYGDFIRGIFNVGTFAFLAIGFILISTSIKKCFKLSIHSSKAKSTPISITTSKNDVNNTMFSLSAKPTEETDKMMFELGALIQDLQTLGDIAIDKW